MATKVNIHIKGLAVCYRVGQSWRVDFLCDANHRLHFSNSLAEGERPLGDARSIIIEHTPQSTGAHEGDDFDEIFNIVKDAHTGGIVKVNPTLPGKHRVSLIINHAKLHLKHRTNKDYGIRRKGSAGQFTRLRKVAETVNLEIKVKVANSFTFEVDNVLEPIPIANNSTLTFNNDCRDALHADCQPGNDSQLFYELIADKQDDSIRYEFTRIELVNNENKSHPDGNCDPIVSEPPPG